MRKLLSITLCILVCTFLMLPVSAAPSRLVDNADILSEAEERTVLQALDKVSKKHECDVVIVTVNDIGSSSMMEYADDYYDYNDYLPDGVLLLVNMGTRDMWISTSGKCISDVYVDTVFDEFTLYVSEGYYETAFLTFADSIDSMLSPPIFFIIAAMLVVGLIAALVGTGILKKQLITVRKNDTATSYVRQGSMNVTVSTDRFLYRNVTRRVRERSSSGGSSHTGSSGRSHGGGGRSF